MNRVVDTSSSQLTGTWGVPLHHVVSLLIWAGAVAFAEIWAWDALVSARAVGHSTTSLILIALRALFALATVLMFTWRLAGRNPMEEAPALFVLGAIAIHSYSLWTAGSPSMLGADLMGAGLLVLALVYRGSLAVWCLGVVPVALVMIVAPAWRWQWSGVALLEVSVRAAIPGVIALAIGTIAVLAQNARRGSEEISRETRDLALRGERLFLEFKAMELDMENFTTAQSQTTSADDSETYTYTTREYPTPRQLSQGIEVEAMGHAELFKAAREAVEAFTIEHKSRRGLKISMTTPSNVTLPMAVSGKTQNLQMVTAALLTRAFSSLGGGMGMIRVELRPGIAGISLIVEDNGRGLNEEVLGRMGGRGFGDQLSIADLRAAAKAAGWKLDVYAKLGVGTRFSVEMPRVDAYAKGARKIAQHVARPFNTNSASSSQHA